MRYGRIYLNRLSKLEEKLCAPAPESELQFIQLEATDKLLHSDRMAIAHMARKYWLSQEIEYTPELSAVMARWSQAVVEVTECYARVQM